MDKYKEDFIRFLLKTNALKFGEFTLKSGRKSPYFLNAGGFDTGETIGRLGTFYASKLKEEFGEDFDVLYGPAYKGISLAVTTAIALANKFGISKNYSFNRKEEKGHADKGIIVGAAIKDGDRVVILDDVFTTGETKEETIELLKQVANVKYTCVLIAVDRKEVGADGKSAIKEFEKKYSIPVISIVTVHEIVELLYNKNIDGKIYINDELKAKIDAYLKEFGVKE
jgi:orotate phosphoribosyltransferase